MVYVCYLIDHVLNEKNFPNISAAFSKRYIILEWTILMSKKMGHKSSEN